MYIYNMHVKGTWLYAHEYTSECIKLREIILISCTVNGENYMWEVL